MAQAHYKGIMELEGRLGERREVGVVKGEGRGEVEAEGGGGANWTPCVLKSGDVISTHLPHPSYLRRPDP